MKQIKIKGNLCNYNKRRSPGSRYSKQKTWPFNPFESGFKMKKTIKRLWNLPSKIKKYIEPRCVSGVPLHGGPERSLYAAVKANLDLSWRSQDVGEDKN